MFLLYDVTSTYFEGEAALNPQARRGCSRDQRSDCKQVCIGLVCTPQGLPLSFEVFAGNRPDVTTVEEIVLAMEEKIRRGRTHPGDGSRHDQRGEHRLPARAQGALPRRHAQELAARA
ncbi:MAG: hypothetical protein ACREIA_26805 [Opitutaceae bacterium]